MARFVRSATIVLTLAFLSACAATSEDTGTTAGAGNSLSAGGAADARGAGDAYAPGSAAEFQAAVGDRVYFGVDRYDLSADSQALLVRQAGWLKTWPAVASSSRATPTNAAPVSTTWRLASAGQPRSAISLSLKGSRPCV